MESEDASYCAKKISSSEKLQIDFLKLSKEQTNVQTKLRPMKSTLLWVSENERIIPKVLEETAKHVIESDDEIKDMLTATSMLLAIKEHIMQLERAISECK
jgi:hypothetical protein